MKQNLLTTTAVLILAGGLFATGSTVSAHRMMGDRDMRMMFIIADSDGDGALSLEEIQTIHERIFNHVDANDDDGVTWDELQDFRREDQMHQVGPMDQMPADQTDQMHQTGPMQEMPEDQTDEMHQTGPMEQMPEDQTDQQD